MKPTLVEPQSPSGYGKVPFATSGPPNLTNTGDNYKNNYKNLREKKKLEIRFFKFNVFLSKKLQEELQPALRV